MATIILVTGGTRSGKSVRAETIALSHSGPPVYIATAEFIDSAMHARIDIHRNRRGDAWDVREAPLDLTQALRETDGRGARLVDCLTIWLSNMMHHGRDWPHAIDELCTELRQQKSPVILVSSEVGLGILPDNALARDFCDAAGTLNQKIAGIADVVEFVVAGLPLKLKP
ncbi:MAG TPA: bifunctional adenosylcobinamide kinase/adenosylcobinamide-phosphate guanylyltransferase [Hyphomicrobium sp.]|nr:bifunctional adenosylcobinamide kinase/adenosylcobinamide-phosphate guanylyltransferase [Hyphomicrobium sp.]